MAIKSVREISFFQTLRDRELKLSFLNSVPEKTNEEIAHFTYYLINMAKEEIIKLPNSQLMYMEPDCINSLSTKLHPEALKNKETINLSVIEIIHLHNLLEHFENNFDKVKEYTKINNIPHQITAFIVVPASYFSTISHIKNNLEHKLGESIVKDYKFKHR